MAGERDRFGSVLPAVAVEAVSTARPGRCPNCRKQARRVHSTHQRTLDDRPLGSHRVIIRLRVRRYFCDRRSCSRTTFVEQYRVCPRATAVPALDWRAGCGRSRSSSAAVPPRGCAGGCG
ncbi:transposase family protein [Streptomyces sp. NPDC001307]|uniref:transposase family protein n=1 Tax=Streptomyces sp. NPDC001307 TaxID=3364560 RepID=UPI00367DE6E9